MKTRRAFLRTLAAAPLMAQDRRRNPQRVLVLGGGLAGLCAAYELQTAGHKATVPEAQLGPGGRVYTIRHRLTPGLYVEAGAEAIPQVHDLTIHYAQEFNLRLLPNGVAGTRTFYHVGGRRIFADAEAKWP